MLRVVDLVPDIEPKANIPTVEFPAADPWQEQVDAAAPEDTIQPENLYLSRVTDAKPTLPKANIPVVPGGAFPATGHNPAFCQPTIWSIVHTPDAAPHW